MKSARKEHVAIASLHDVTERVFISEKSVLPTKNLKLTELAILPLESLIRSINHWWLQRLEQHYLICAEVEEQRVRDAQLNVAYYQKRAVLARSARR